VKKQIYGQYEKIYCMVMTFLFSLHSYMANYTVQLLPHPPHPPNEGCYTYEHYWKGLSCWENFNDLMNQIAIFYANIAPNACKQTAVRDICDSYLTGKRAHESTSTNGMTWALYIPHLFFWKFLFQLRNGSRFKHMVCCVTMATLMNTVSFTSTPHQPTRINFLQWSLGTKAVKPALV